MIWAAGVFLYIATVQDPDIGNLQHKDPKIRKAAAIIVQQKAKTEAIPYLIEGLKDPVPEVREACHAALVALTGQDRIHPDDVQTWKDWWKNEGKKRFPVTGTESEQFSEEVESAMASVRQMQDRMDRDFQNLKSQIDASKRQMERAENRINTMSIVMIALGFLFILIMFYFVGHVSSRIKEWKDLMRTADSYLADAKNVTERVDAILDEVDKKKAEVYELFGKVKDEAEEEVGRYVDLLQQNSDHHLREQVMELRQKAEKELESSVGEFKSALEHEMRRVLEAAEERFQKFAEARRERFLKQIEAHRMFLEASFYSANGRIDEAIRTYQRVVEVMPDNVVAWVSLGNAYREDEKYEEAIEAYRKALGVSPNDPPACYAMAAAFAKLKNKEKMLEYLRRASVHDGEYKDDALNDPAFQDYWNDPEFKDVAEG